MISIVRDIEQAHKPGVGGLNSPTVNRFENSAKPKKKTIFEPLYYAYKEGGIEAATKEYRRLKSNYPDEYKFDEAGLVIIGSKLQIKKKYTDSIKMFELCLNEYPGGDYLYYAHYLLCKSLKETGEIEKAFTHCEKSIEANPEFQGASNLLEELKKM